MKKRVCILFLLIVALTLSTVWASATSGTVVWNERFEGSYTRVDSTVSWRHDFWRHSDGTWRAGPVTIGSAAIDAGIWRDGRVPYDRDIVINTAHPQEVRDFLSRGGRLEDVKISFSFHNPHLMPTEAFDGAVRYSVSGSSLEVRFKPVFRVVHRAFVHPDTAVKAPVMDPQYGMQGLAMWSKVGRINFGGIGENGAGISPLEILNGFVINTAGDIKPGTYAVSGWPGGMPAGSYSSDEMRVGVGTFNNAGAVGLLYSIPIIATYHIPPILPPNNLEMVFVEFLDSRGNTTTTPIAGQQYSVRYHIRYHGQNMLHPVTVFIQSGNVRNSRTGNVNYLSSPWVVSRSLRFNDQQTIAIDVGTFTISQPSIFANGTIRPDPLWNADPRDDYGEAEIVGQLENLTLTIEEVSPQVTRVFAPQATTTENYEIRYRINYQTQSRDRLVTDVVLTLNSNSLTNPSAMTITQNVTLEPGMNTFYINTGNIGVRRANGNFTVSLEVNRSRQRPQLESTFVDNRDTVNVIVQDINPGINPCVGNIHRQNTWSVTYNVTTRSDFRLEVYFVRRSRCVAWNALGVCTRTERWEERRERCVGGTTRRWTQVSTLRENLAITAVNFRSKDSGPSPVNLLNRDGVIKAGYGFELEIIATYSGTESPRRPEVWSTRCNGQSVSPGAFNLRDLPNRIYVILPDGQIISNVASAGIRNLLDCTVSGSTNVSSSGSATRTLRCQVRQGDTWGNMTTRRLYVDENTRDGNYDITVCTQAFSGTAPNAPPLFDLRRVRFIVDGRYTDDVTTHIVQ